MQRIRLFGVLLGVALPTFPGAAFAQFVITSPDGASSLKLGLLGQLQGEWVETAEGSGVSQNLFLRRTRLLVEGHITGEVAFRLCVLCQIDDRTHPQKYCAMFERPRSFLFKDLSTECAGFQRPAGKSQQVRSRSRCPGPSAPDLFPRNFRAGAGNLQMGRQQRSGPELLPSARRPPDDPV